MLFAVSQFRCSRTWHNNADNADRVIDSCKEAFEQLLNLQMEHKEANIKEGVITVETVEVMLQRRLTPPEWGKIAQCGGLRRFKDVWKAHLKRKMVVTIVGKTFMKDRLTVDGYNNLQHLDLEVCTDVASYRDRLPGTVIAARTESSDSDDHLPNMDELVAKVNKLRCHTPVS